MGCGSNRKRREGGNRQKNEVVGDGRGGCVEMEGQGRFVPSSGKGGGNRGRWQFGFCCFPISTFFLPMWEIRLPVGWYMLGKCLCVSLSCGAATIDHLCIMSGRRVLQPKCSVLLLPTLPSLLRTKQNKQPDALCAGTFFISRPNQEGGAKVRVDSGCHYALSLASGVPQSKLLLPRPQPRSIT